MRNKFASLVSHAISTVLLGGALSVAHAAPPPSSTKGKTPSAQPPQATARPAAPTGGILQTDMKKGPTYVKSDSFTLHSVERTFEYTGNVQMTHDDLIVTCDSMEGKYNEKNQIQEIIAHSNVVITKGENIKGTSEKAVYEAAADTLTLTDNPELQQGQSALTADAIKIFLKENRSMAEGSVRMKMAKVEDPEKAKKPAH